MALREKALIIHAKEMLIKLFNHEKFFVMLRAVCLREREGRFCVLKKRENSANMILD